MWVVTLFSDNIVEEGLQMMHHTKFIKRCFAQPRLLLRTFLLGMLLTGCFAVMADLGVAMASAQSLARQDSTPHKHLSPKHKNDDREDPRSEGNPDVKGDPGHKGKVKPVSNNNNTGSANNATGSNNTSGAPGGGGVPVGGGGVGGGGVGGGAPGGGGPGGGGPGGPGGGGPGGGRPGLPPTGSDPGNNPLP